MTKKNDYQNSKRYSSVHPILISNNKIALFVYKHDKTLQSDEHHLEIDEKGVLTLTHNIPSYQDGKYFGRIQDFYGFILKHYTDFIVKNIATIYIYREIDIIKELDIQSMDKKINVVYVQATNKNRKPYFKFCKDENTLYVYNTNNAQEIGLLLQDFICKHCFDFLKITMLKCYSFFISYIKQFYNIEIQLSGKIFAVYLKKNKPLGQVLLSLERYCHNNEVNILCERCIFTFAPRLFLYDYDRLCETLMHEFCHLVNHKHDKDFEDLLDKTFSAWLDVQNGRKIYQNPYGVISYMLMDKKDYEQDFLWNKNMYIDCYENFSIK